MENSRDAGFSLLEILIALSIMAALVVLTLASFSVLRENQILNNTTEEIISLVGEARSKTLSSKESSQYGVHFETSRAVLFKGTDFFESDPDNIELSFSTLVEISNISLNGGGPNLIFQRLTGKTNEYGTITLRIVADTSKEKIININSSGLVSATN